MSGPSKPYHFAMILGATGGIGYRLAHSLAGRVEKIYLFGTNSPKLSTLSHELLRKHNFLSVHEVNINFSDDQPPISASMTSLNLEKNVGLLVNCAGTYLSRKLVDTSNEEIHKHFLINAIRPMQITANLIGYLKPGSLIINIGSSLSYHPKANRVLSSSVKHAVRGFSLSLAEELAAVGIRVCLINPRSVATPLLKKNTSSDSYQKAMPVEDIAKTVGMILDCDPKTLFSEINVGASQGFLGR